MKDVNILTNNGVTVNQSLELFGDMEMYDETLKDFLDMVDGKLASLDNRKSMSDMVNYAIEVHALKSDARYLGFTTLADLAYESELKSKAGDIVFVQENHPKIIAEAQRMVGVAKQYLGLAPVEAQQPVATPVVPPVMAPQSVVESTAVNDPMAEAIVAQASVQEVPQQPMMGVVPPVQVVQPTIPVQPMPQMVQPMQNVAPVVPEPQQAVQFYPTDNQVQQTVQYYPNGVQPQPVMQPVYPAQATAPVQKDGIILIVDDSTLVANFVKKIFDSKYDVLIAEDGAKAIEIVDQEDIRKNIKACLLDLNMPNVDGYQVLEHFKQNGYFVRMPVAVESGVEDTASIDKVNSYPIVDILSKPFNERDVQRVIEKCLATYF